MNEETTTDQQALTIQQAINLALQYHTAGDLPKAEGIYNQIIQAEPNQPVALHLLGLIAHQVGESDRAVKLIGDALKVRPDYLDALGNLGNALVAIEQYDGAITNYTKALNINPNIPELYNAIGLAYRGVGNLNGAIENYEIAVAKNPKFTEAYSNLGNALVKSNKIDEAVISLNKALTLNPKFVEAFYNLGIAYYEIKQFDEAVESFNKAIAIKPDYTEAHYNLGNVLQELGKLDEAVASYNMAITIKPDYADVYFNLGITLNDLGSFDEAEASYNKAIAIMPDYAKAHNNLGIAHKEVGKLDEAVSSYNKAISINPDFTEAHNNLGNALQELGKHSDAFMHHRRAIKLNPENSTFWAGLATSLRSVSFTSIDGDLLQDLLSLVDQPTIHLADFVQPILSALGHHPEFSQTLTLAGAVKPDSRLDYHRTVAQLSGTPLFLRLIALTHVGDLKIERMLTTLRRLMLQEAIAGNIKDDGLPFTSALALHCFTNEYVFAEIDEETLSVEHLQKQISELVEHKQDVPSSLIVTLAAYRPLHKFDWAQGLTEHEWGKEVSAVIERQISEPFTELSLRPQIPCLTSVQDTVSRSVQEQYEENPYPRWVKTGLVEKSQSIGSVLRAAPLYFDLGDYESPSNPEILIAGCGTGQHSLGTASRFKDARVLAIDLSLSSLSYAARKTDELGVTNIEYAQADIMELGTLDRQFDLIESAGVLHHLGDPMAGWKVLVDLLKPGGLMKIGLYSETARQHIVAGRSMIAEMGYTSSAEDIRQCRQDFIIMADDSDINLENIFKIKDFYSLSECRDLLFHVQEHRFTIPQISEALDVFNLKFLGFVMKDQSAIKRFKEIYPTKSDLTSLTLWHEFEQQHPGISSGVRKAKSSGKLNQLAWPPSWNCELGCNFKQNNYFSHQSRYLKMF
jgi:tetratricopeptide (TPR) repeat protein/2-polyprenyl-3-methyl-5-hydroxy-6-metoxy-1,4-benzoquinol methylase